MERFDRYVGFVSPPASFDTTPQQFLNLCADPVGVVQHMAHYPGAEYDSPTADAERRLDHLRDGIAGLRDAHAEIVAQVGGYWSLPYIGNIESARELQDALTDECSSGRRPDTSPAVSNGPKTETTPGRTTDDSRSNPRP